MRYLFLTLFLAGSCQLLITPTFATFYYISPSGNDANGGTSQTNPVKTFGRAWQLTHPGDTLWVMDGVYYDSLHPSYRNGRPNSALPLTTDANGNGAADMDEPTHPSFVPYDDPVRTQSYIKVKALNDGQATIDGEFVRPAIALGDCFPTPACPVDAGEETPLGNYFWIEGLVARNSVQTNITSTGHHNVFKRVSAYNARPYGNHHGISAGSGSSFNFYEDCLAAGSFRIGIFAYNSNYTVFRRCFTYWQEWDGREFLSNEWPWGNALEMYNSSYGIIENGIAIGAYPDVGYKILSNMSSTSSPNAATHNKLLGSVITNSGIYPDGTPWSWGMTRPLNPTDNGGALKRYWEWPDQRVAIVIRTWGQNAIVQNTLLQDLFAFNNMNLGLTETYEYADSPPINTTANRLTLLNNKQDVSFADSIDGPKGTDLITERVSHTTITNSRISKACSGSALSTCTTNPYTGEGARLAHRYYYGTLKDGTDGTPAQNLWPWSMQDRILKEIGYDITGSTTDILMSHNTPTGKTIGAPPIFPVPPLGNPLKNISGATYLSPVTVSLTLPTGAASLHYTLDGSEPTLTSPTYSAPFTVSATTLVKAVAFSAGGIAGHQRSAYYRINPAIANSAPTLTAAVNPFVDPHLELVWPQNSVTLTGTAEDYTLPNTNSALTTTWTKLDGPGTVTFGQPTSPRSSATFSTPGFYRLRLTGTDGSLSTYKDVEVRVWPTDLQGIRHTVPGRIDAENYGSGGEGVGHHQVVSSGDTRYRPGSKVDLDYAYNDHTGYSISRVYPGEWYAYPITITQAGSYTLKLRYSGDASAEGGQIHYDLIDSQNRVTNLTGPITLHSTGSGNRFYSTLDVPLIVPLSTGDYTLKLVIDRAPTGIATDPLRSLVNYIDLTTSSTAPTLTPTPQGPGPFDFDGDGNVDYVDLNLLLKRSFTIFDFNRLFQSL